MIEFVGAYCSYICGNLSIVTNVKDATCTRYSSTVSNGVKLVFKDGQLARCSQCEKEQTNG
jgi:hypothetical protein